MNRQAKYSVSKQVKFDSSVSNWLQSHSSEESVEHFLTKCLVARAILEKGRSFGMEIAVGERGDKVDVLEEEGEKKYLAYEIETKMTKQSAYEKAWKYTMCGVRDVVFLDLSSEAMKSFFDGDWVNMKGLFNYVKARVGTK